MIKIEDLREFRPVYRYEDGEYVTLDTVRAVIAEAAQEASVSVDFYSDQVKSGGLFNKSVEEHKNDYYLICIRVQHQGNLAYVIINDFGSSSQMDKFARSEYAKQDRRGKSLSYKIGSVIGSTVRNLGKNRQKLEEEQRYYDSIQHVLDQVIS